MWSRYHINSIHLSSYFLTSIENSSEYPVSDQTARLLQCTEFRLLGLIFENFTLSYYTSFLGMKIHTPRLMAILKWFWEDIPQFCVQMLYIYLTSGKPSYVVYISILLSVVCLIISFTKKHTIKSPKTTKIYENSGRKLFKLVSNKKKFFEK